MERVSATRGVELTRLGELERRWQASAERATDELVHGCVRLRELQQRILAIAARAPVRLTSQGSKLKGVAEELEDVANSVFGAVHHELLWAYRLGDDRRASEAPAAAPAASGGKVTYVHSCECVVTVDVNSRGRATVHVKPRYCLRTEVRTPAPAMPKRRTSAYSVLLNSAAGAVRGRMSRWGSKGAAPGAADSPQPRREIPVAEEEALETAPAPAKIGSAPH